MTLRVVVVMSLAAMCSCTTISQPLVPKAQVAQQEAIIELIAEASIRRQAGEDVPCVITGSRWDMPSTKLVQTFLGDVNDFDYRLTEHPDGRIEQSLKIGSVDQSKPIGKFFTGISGAVLSWFAGESLLKGTLDKTAAALSDNSTTASLAGEETIRHLSNNETSYLLAQ